MSVDLASRPTREIILPHNWSIRKDQKPLWDYLMSGAPKDSTTGKRAVCVAHRQWGKDTIAMHYAACAAFIRPGNYWHMLPNAEQSRKVIWEAINPDTGKLRIDEAFPMEIRKSTNNTEMKIDFNTPEAASWRLVGSDNYNSLVGSMPVFIAFSEWALANPLAWAYLGPILAKNNGVALFIYTARGDNHGKSLYESAKLDPKWFSQMIRADQSPVYSAERLEDERKGLYKIFGQDAGEAIYQQEYFCSFAGAQLGAYYARVLEDARKDGRITRVPLIADHEVHTAWDLGRSVGNSTSIWFFQVVNDRFRFIDYEEGISQDLAHYVNVLKGKTRYSYGNHYVPHDAAHHSVQTQYTNQQIMENLGLRNIVLVPRAESTQAVNEGILAGVTRFSQCEFDEEKCRLGLAALSSYHAQWDENKKILDQRPYHDWSSNGSDAFRTFAVGYKPKIKHQSVYQMMGISAR